jgi:hypothetical protein
MPPAIVGPTGGDMGGGGGTWNGRDGSLGPVWYMLAARIGAGGPPRVVGRRISGPTRGGEGKAVAVCALGRWFEDAERKLDEVG